MSKDSDAKIFSVIGGCRRSGRWLVPKQTNMMTLFGRAIIDLRQANTNADELEFTCLSVFANITFIVPEGAEVRPSGMAILGSSRSVVPVSDVPCELPPISIDATTVFGRMRVRTTDTDPQAKHKKRRFRRDKVPEVITVPTPAVEATPDEPAFAGVDLAAAQAAAPQPQTVQAATAAPLVAPAAAPAAPVVTPAAALPVATAAPVTVATDLSKPIERFVPDQASPIHNVEVPESAEGALADPSGVAAAAVQLPAEPAVAVAAPAAQATEGATEAVAAQTPVAELPGEPELALEPEGPPPVHLPAEGELIS